MVCYSRSFSSSFSSGISASALHTTSRATPCEFEGQTVEGAAASRDTRPSFARRSLRMSVSFGWRFAALVLVASGCLPGCLLCPVASAQTATYVGLQTALNTSFNEPAGIAVDMSGNLFVIDQGNEIVYEVQAVSGQIPASPTIVPLGGSGGHVFNTVYSVAVDGTGNVFVADQGANEIFEIPSSGGYNTVTQIATGYTFSGPSGVAVDTSGNLYVTDTGNNAVVEISEPGFTSVTPLGSGINAPTGIAVDSSGDVFIADSGVTIKEIVAPEYSSVVTDAGGFGSIDNLAIDAQGNLYASDENSAHDSIYEIPAAGAYSTVLTLAHYSQSAQGVAVDANGDILSSYFEQGEIQELIPGSANLGSVNLSSSNSAGILTFTFTTSGTIGTPQVLTLGATAADFTDLATGTCNTNGTSHVYSVSDTCTVNVKFAPLYTGDRRGAVDQHDQSWNHTHWLGDLHRYGGIDEDQPQQRQSGDTEFRRRGYSVWSSPERVRRQRRRRQ